MKRLPKRPPPASSFSSSWPDLVLTWYMHVRDCGREGVSERAWPGAKQTWYLHLFPSLSLTLSLSLSLSLSLPSTISIFPSFLPPLSSLAAAALITSSIIHGNCLSMCVRRFDPTLRQGGTGLQRVREKPFQIILCVRDIVRESSVR